jgi:hypothetical protein
MPALGTGPRAAIELDRRLVAALNRERSLRTAIDDALRTLEAPFSASDEKPATIQDAIDTLRTALG